MTSVLTRIDLADLRSVARSIEPVASVYLGGPSLPPADMSEDRLLRWRALATLLSDQGADPQTVTAIEDYLQGLPYPAETAVIAAAGQIRLAYPLPGGIPQDLARFGAPPTVTPVLAWLQRHPAYILVIVDRTGADITAVRAGARRGTTRSVAGPDDEIERNAPGGWAQARYPRRAEDSWLHNAASVAAAVTGQLAGVRGDLVIMAGDVRACQLLTDRLNRTGVPPRIVHIPGGRSPDGSAAHRPGAVQAVVDGYAAERQRELTRTFAAGLGASRTAVTGAEETLSALAAGQVETLLVVDRPVDDRMAWFTAAGWCGAASAERRPPDARPGRLVDVAVRSALISHADVQVLAEALDADLVGGIGAICRYS